MNEISTGDSVKVDFVGNVSAIYGEVLYIPCATGDCWHIRSDPPDNQLHYIQSFEQITLLKKRELP
jgi:hypothetical protein